MSVALSLVDKALVPDTFIRAGIRKNCRARISEQKKDSCEAQDEALNAFAAFLRTRPIAELTEKANEQHYEVPAEFFLQVLGKHLKYSSCYYDNNETSLDIAEARMLALTCERAQLQDGQAVLELGCGWGSLTLWMAEKYPNSSITGVSNSSSQKDFILATAKERNLKNVKIITADINALSIEERFDRVVSVEMFEHMRNYEKLFAKIAKWLKADGKMFCHVFCHKEFAYTYESEGDDNWMGQHFFSGGTMPSQDLFYHFNKDLVVNRRWLVSGTHYQKTSEAWAANMYAKKELLMPILSKIYGQGKEQMWFERWKVFFLACAELFGYNNGEEWRVAHYLFSRR